MSPPHSTKNDKQSQSVDNVGIDLTFLCVFCWWGYVRLFMDATLIETLG